MNRFSLFGGCCAVGGILQAIVFQQVGDDGSPRWAMVIFVITALLLMGGPLGVYRQAVSPNRVSKGFTALALLGLLLYFSGALYMLTYPEQEFKQVFTPIGAQFQAIGMIGLGILTLRAKRWQGWKAYIPLLIGLFFYLQLPVQAIFFFEKLGHPSYSILGLWGVLWGALGYIIYSNAQAVPFSNNQVQAS